VEATAARMEGKGDEGKKKKKKKRTHVPVGVDLAG
jgi:hypothetical protein